MTASTTALNYALKYVGTKEHPAGSNRGPLIDEWQKAVDMIGQPWCGALVHAALAAAGVKDLSSRMRYVPYIVDDARKGVNGLKGLVSWEDALPGDLVIYQWDTGAVDHVGLLRRVLTTSTLLDVEGNTAVGNDSNGGQVMVRERNRKFVAYIVRPKYPDAPHVPLTPCEWPGVTLKVGVRGAVVKVVQGWINTLDDAGYDYNRLEVDGAYGDATMHAVKLYQSRHRLEADGVVGPLTWRAMCSSVRAAA